jgi:hypothetical protein
MDFLIDTCFIAAWKVSIKHVQEGGSVKHLLLPCARTFIQENNDINLHA